MNAAAASFHALALALGSRVEDAPGGGHAGLLLGLASLDADEAAKASEGGGSADPWIAALRLDLARIEADGERLGLEDARGIAALVQGALDAAAKQE
jgi:hypothetical protein